ncbi:hypothetical protein, partial [Streptomyces sp. NPDC018352]|uniref:hypothetical protein n=1 Tax=Streptomyces sp. NPDC018352 TaxID=3157194 RepID=UPI0033D77024
MAWTGERQTPGAPLTIKVQPGTGRPARFVYGPSMPTMVPNGSRSWAILRPGSIVIGLAAAENLIRPVQAACWYSWRMPPSRSRFRMSRRVICS